MREALTAHGVEGELLLITDGDRAVRFVRELVTRPEACPDLAIVDLNLPKRSGREVLAAMSESTPCRKMQVVVLSSSDQQQDRIEATALGASRYICKPLRLAEFLKLGAEWRKMLEGE